MIVLLPLHYYAEGSLGNEDLLSKLDMGNIPEGSKALWVHAVCVWLVVFVATRRLDKAHVDFLERRFAWISSLTAPRATTLLVENIPPEYCSDHGLRAYFVQLFGESAVERTYIVRKTRNLRNAL